MTELANTVRRWIEGQTFSPRTGRDGITVLDAQAAAYADLDDVRLIGLVEGDWPERSRRSIFYPASLLGQLGWPNEIDRLTAARARFHDLLRLARARVSISTFTLEDDAIVAPSPFVEEIEACGLEVQQVARAATARVFAQQALREAAVVPGAGPIPPAWLADRPNEAEWLEVRAGRSPVTDPAFHGAAGPRAPAVYAVSHVERYLECPFKYFASHVLGLDEERDEDAGLSPRERGQFLHEVFQQFFLAWAEAGHRSITAATLQDALAIFETVVEARLARLSDVDRALERTYLLGSAAAPGLAERAFAFEIEQGVGVVERLLEHALEGEFELTGEDGPVRLRLRGKADRIDLLDDGTLRIVDYKLGRAPKPGRALQLPVYGVCASQQLEGRHGQSWVVLCADKGVAPPVGWAKDLQQLALDGIYVLEALFERVLGLMSRAHDEPPPLQRDASQGTPASAFGEGSATVRHRLRWQLVDSATSIGVRALVRIDSDDHTSHADLPIDGTDRKPVVGMSDSGRQGLPLWSYATGETRRAGTSLASQANRAGRRFASPAPRTSESRAPSGVVVAATSQGPGAARPGECAVLRPAPASMRG